MNNHYSFYLFCKLRDLIIPSKLEYDLLYSEDMALFEEYNDSIFSINMKGEYECIVDFLNYVKENKTN